MRYFVINHRDTAIRASIGNGYAGEFEASYDELVTALGLGIGPSSDEKADAQWVLKFEDGSIATVYNYKTGPAYGGPPVQQNTDWHIGGKSRNVVLRVIEALREKGVKVNGL